MPRKQRVMEVVCYFCGNRTSTFTATASKKLFCHIGGAIGVPPKIDCHIDWLKFKETENVRKKEKEQSLQQQRQKLIQEKKEKKVNSYSSINKKLEAYYDALNTKKKDRTYL
tara:strand:+ start:256 stop:591 length:336 start_codon:yes stop_codon:yes gene_type:complete